MKKFDIVSMDFVQSVNEAPYIDARIRVLPGYDGRVGPCDVIKSLIECDFSTNEWCGVSTSYTDYTVFSGRGNGKTKFFYDWYRCAISSDKCFAVKQVIFNNPATIILWADGTKTVVKCQDGDQFIPETGIAMCFMKKAMDNKANFNNIFKKHIVNQSIEERAPMAKSTVTTKTYKHINKETIYRLLREKKWTVPEFAEYAGVHVTSVYAWLRGKGITSKNLSKLTKILYVSEEVLIND